MKTRGLRLSEHDIALLEAVKRETGQRFTDTIRRGIRLAADEHAREQAARARLAREAAPEPSTSAA